MRRSDSTRGSRGCRTVCRASIVAANVTFRMEGFKWYKLKDHPDFPGEIDIQFSSEHRVELLCSTCDAITFTGIKDGKGHSFCQACASVQTDKDNEFTCVICGWQGDRSTMEENAEEWAILERKDAFCPNKKAKCSFTGELKEVLIHYKRCNSAGKAPCGLCGVLLNRKVHARHISMECPKRIVECTFCKADLEACVKTAHETSCPHRPGTCEHCGQEFGAYFLLEREHYPKCQRMPVFCPYKDLGCGHQAPRCQMRAHLSDGSHIPLLVDAISSQRSEVKYLLQNKPNFHWKHQGSRNIRTLSYHEKGLKKENAALKERVRGLEKENKDLTKDNAVLKKRMQDIEDRQKTEEYVRANIVDAQDDLREKMSELQTAALQTQPEVDGRIKELEARSAICQEPLGKLLKEIAKFR